MSWIKKISQEHIYLFSFIITAIAIGLLYLGNFWLFTSKEGLDFSLNRVLAYVMPILFVFILCYLSGNLNKIKFRKAGMFTGLIFGWLIIGDGIYGFILSYMSLDKSNIIVPSVQKVICFSLVLIFIGIFEEVLCRGIILNVMLEKWGLSKSGVIRAVVFSSVFFSMGHLVNLISSPDIPVRTFTQVAYTFLQGILYAAIYLRSKNIWTCIIIHSVYDTLSFVLQIFQKAGISSAQVDTSVISGVTIAILYIPVALYGLFLLRKVWVMNIERLSELT